MKNPPSMHARLPDPIQAGLASGWHVIDASRLQADRVIDADVVIVGSGAGGGVTAEILSLAGLKVVIVEEGALRSSKDFNMREAEAYPQMYQESAARKTRDKAITILQGRTVGGSTTVNWTSSLRTPPGTLAYWGRQFGLTDYTPAALAPWFSMMEQRLSIVDWPVPPNQNNELLRRGAQRLGFAVAAIRRNVKGCRNLGYCGMGCPTNAKQSMLVTTIPSALDAGAMLITHARAERCVIKGERVDHLVCTALDAGLLAPSGRQVTLRARHFVVAGGAINSPALLQRSNAPDPHGLLGKRTFLHPSVLCASLFEQRVDAYAGAPQTMYTDHFQDAEAIDGRIGYKIEAPPLHPLLLATCMAGFGDRHAALMAQFPHMQALLALLRDGFHPQSSGGSVRLNRAGVGVLDYPMSSLLWDGVKRALLSMAEIQFAAGARSVHPIHEMAPGYTSWAQAQVGINALPYKKLLTRIVSAHVMGGCTMCDDPRVGVTASDGRYHGMANLSVHDGSLFPTSIGAHPQLSIYAIGARLASMLASTLTGRPAPRPVAAPDK